MSKNTANNSERNNSPDRPHPLPEISPEKIIPTEINTTGEYNLRQTSESAEQTTSHQTTQHFKPIEQTTSHQSNRHFRPAEQSTSHQSTRDLNPVEKTTPQKSPRENIISSRPKRETRIPAHYKDFSLEKLETSPKLASPEKLTSPRVAPGIQPSYWPIPSTTPRTDPLPLSDWPILSKENYTYKSTKPHSADHSAAYLSTVYTPRIFSLSTQLLAQTTTTMPYDLSDGEIIDEEELTGIPPSPTITNTLANSISTPSPPPRKTTKRTIIKRVERSTAQSHTQVHKQSFVHKSTQNNFHDLFNFGKRCKQCKVCNQDMANDSLSTIRHHMWDHLIVRICACGHLTQTHTAMEEHSKTHLEPSDITNVDSISYAQARLNLALPLPLQYPTPTPILIQSPKRTKIPPSQSPKRTAPRRDSTEKSVFSRLNQSKLPTITKAQVLSSPPRPKKRKATYPQKAPLLLTRTPIPIQVAQLTLQPSATPKAITPTTSTGSQTDLIGFQLDAQQQITLDLIETLTEAQGLRALSDRMGSRVKSKLELLLKCNKR